MPMMGTGYLQGGPYNIKLRFDLLQLNTYELIFIRVLKEKKKKTAGNFRRKALTRVREK